MIKSRNYAKPRRRGFASLRGRLYAKPR